MEEIYNGLIRYVPEETKIRKNERANQVRSIGTYATTKFTTYVIHSN
jgi:hypothetical protein